MTEERINEIIDDVCHGRVVKMTEEEVASITWRYFKHPTNCCSTVIFTIKDK